MYVQNPTQHELSRKECLGSNNGKAFRNSSTQEPQILKALYLVACLSFLLTSFTDRILLTPTALAFHPGGQRKRGGAGGLSRIWEAF